MLIRCPAMLQILCHGRSFHANILVFLVLCTQYINTFKIISVSRTSAWMRASPCHKTELVINDVKKKKSIHFENFFRSIEIKTEDSLGGSCLQSDDYA